MRRTRLLLILAILLNLGVASAALRQDPLRHPELRDMHPGSKPTGTGGTGGTGTTAWTIDISYTPKPLVVGKKVTVTAQFNNHTLTASPKFTATFTCEPLNGVACPFNTETSSVKSVNANSFKTKSITSSKAVKQGQFRFKVSINPGGTKTEVQINAAAGTGSGDTGGSNGTGQSSNVSATEAVAAHNKARAAVGSPPLVWSTAIASYAQEWANHMAETGKFEHRPNGKYGENLSWNAGGHLSITQFVDGAVQNEQKNYDPVTGKCKSSGECGHYTQIVWKNTTQVGCGMASAPDAKYKFSEYWVCNYSPPGNYVGEKAY